MVSNNRKMYEIEKKWDQLAEHNNTHQVIRIMSSVTVVCVICGEEPFEKS